MRFVAENRPVAAIREAFDSRLPLWTPGSTHWLCLVVRDATSQAPLGVTGYIHREDDCAEVGFLFAPEAQGKGYGFESPMRVNSYTFGFRTCFDMLFGIVVEHQEWVHTLHVQPLYTRNELVYFESVADHVRCRWGKYCFYTF